MVYGRAARDRRRRLWLQYWSFLAYNAQDRGIVRTGRHEGDWEVVQFRLGPGQVPDLAVYAQHSWAERCPWASVIRDDGAPVVLVANGSHAAYFGPGRHDRPWPDPNDEADGRGRKVRPRLETIAPGSPRWLAWPGRWGRSEGGFVPGEQPSPRGPAFQAEGPWSDPEGFAARARVCGSGAPPLPLAARLGAGSIAVLALGLGSLLVRRLRRL